MARFVYDGVPGNGDLFAGIKFCILQRVPIRSTLIQNVESNGGEIVPLEKHADMTISDDARPKLAPPNSYSWKYIEQSVKNGELEDAEKHLIHAASTSKGSPASIAPGHTAGGSRPTKSTRTDFTAADDKFLLQWLAKGQAQGMALMGNVIYKQLEKANPRHTYQSWRDRYSKYYRNKPLPAVPNDDSLGPVDEVVRGQHSRPQAGYQVGHAEDDQGDGEDQESSALQNHNTRVGTAPNQTPRIVKGDVFTQADHDLVESEYDAILEVERKRDHIVEAWNAFAEVHGRHTAGEWYQYYRKVVGPVMKKKLQKSINAEKRQPDIINIDDNDAEEEQDLEEKLQKSTDSSKFKTDVIANDHKTGEDEAMRAIDVNSSEHSIDEFPARVLLSKSPNVPSSPRESGSRKPSSTRRRSNIPADDKRDESVPEKKAAFLDDLRTIARATHKQIEPRQEVCGVQVQLYDLWSTVIDKFEGFENVEAGDMWGRVATHLDFNISKHLHAPMELRNLYSTFLVNVARVDEMSGADVSKAKAMAADAYATTQEKQKSVTATPVTEPAAPPSLHTAPPGIWSLKNPPKHSNAPPRDTPKASNARAAVKPGPSNISGNANNISKSLPARTAIEAPPTTNLQVTAVQEEDRQTTESPIQPQAAAESLESPNPSIEGADEEELTAADLVMLTKLVDFAKDCLGIQINVTGTAICGRWVSLPKFRKVVNGLGGYKTVTRKRLWKQVAAELGYKQMGTYQGMAKAMQDAYEDVLMHYDDYRKQVREERERRVSMGIQGLRSFDDEDSGLAAPYTLPAQTGSSSAQKRSRNASEDDGPTSVPDTFKRRRLGRKGKGKEIQAEVPESPEHIYNSSMLSQEALVAKDSQLIELSSDPESDGTEAYQPIKRPLFPKPAAPPAPVAVEEPDTQEFSFIEEGSPSQQRNSEAMASVSPTVPARKKAESSVKEDNHVEKADPVIEYFDTCTAEGYTPEVAMLAFSAANMNPVLAPKIIKRLAKGQPIPDNIRGIWTPKDDDTLLMGLPVGHPQLVKLIKKHGSEELKERMEFLENLGEEAEDE